MNYEEAKKFATENQGEPIYKATYDGEVWSAGRMVEVGDVISYHATKAEAEAACRDFETVDFDSTHCATSVELCDRSEFDA